MKRYDYNGEQLTVKEISQRTKISESKIRYRLKQGYPITGKVEEKYSYDGQELTLTEWSKLLGITKSTLVLRLRYGMSYDKVFTSEKHDQSGKHSKHGIYFDPMTGNRGTRAEMAQQYNVTPQTIHVWLKLGKLEKLPSDEHVGEVKSGWLVTDIDEETSELLCECEICGAKKIFKTFNAIKQCKNPEHKVIQARKRLMGKKVKTMTVVEVKASESRNIRVRAHCDACDGTFEIWEANMYKGCKCQK